MNMKRWLSGFFLIIGMGSSLAFAQERWLNLPSIPNGRDAGGYATLDGNTMRWGVLYRSDQPLYLTQEECSILLARGIKTVVDLRYTAQQAAWPNSPCLGAFTDYEPAGIWSDYDFSLGLSLEELYRMAVNQYAASFATVFEVLADPERIPMLVHCVAGKDRTGMAVALVQLLLGVSEEDVMAQYLLSNEKGYGVAASWLQAVLDRIHEDGGIQSFLRKRGVSSQTQWRVKQNLLEEPSSFIHWETYE